MFADNTGVAVYFPYPYTSLVTDSIAINGKVRHFYAIVLHLLLIVVYNKASITVAIDEIDSGVFEYLLGELLRKHILVFWAARSILSTMRIS